MEQYTFICIVRDSTRNVSGGGGLEPRTASVTVNSAFEVEGSTSRQTCANESRENTESKQHHQPSHGRNGDDKETTITKEQIKRERSRVTKK